MCRPISEMRRSQKGSGSRRGAPGRRRGLSDAGFLSPNVCGRRSSHAVSPRHSLFCVSAWTRDRQRHIAGAALKKQFIFSSASLLKPPLSAFSSPHPFLDHVQASETTPLQALKPPGRAGPSQHEFLASVREMVPGPGFGSDAVAAAFAESRVLLLCLSLRISSSHLFFPKGGAHGRGAALCRGPWRLLERRLGHAGACAVGGHAA